MLYALDSWAMQIMGVYAQKSALANKFLINILPLPSVKLLPIVSCLWWLWFSKALHLRSRLAVVQGFLGMIAAILLARALQNYLPERPRPLHSGDANFVLPLGADNSSLERWSSFPSDHAVVAFALSTAIWRASKPVGAACYVWSIFVVCLPRIYAGWHYASDILAGAFIGMAIALIIERVLPLEGRIMPYIETAEKSYTGIFYTLFFAFSIETVTMFDDMRCVVRSLSSSLSKLV